MNEEKRKMENDDAGKKDPCEVKRSRTGPSENQRLCTCDVLGQDVGEVGAEAAT